MRHPVLPSASTGLTVLLIALSLVLASATVMSRSIDDPRPFTVVLGVAQDAGFPQAGCTLACCAEAWEDPGAGRYVACLAIVDPLSGERWIIDATPDFRRQLRLLDEVAPAGDAPGLAGILLTHGHIGHYTGLMFLGHESIGARGVAVHAMPRMREFLSAHGPWDQLVRYRNIVLRDLAADEPVRLNERITVTPFRVPHREEYTEAVGFRIEGPERTVVFIPDIDKWTAWDRRVEDVIESADVAYLDGTFYAEGEIPGRAMSEIPHPFIVESMERLGTLPRAERSKVRFIHLNHTNPVLRSGGEAARAVRKAGFRVARQGEREPI